MTLFYLRGSIISGLLKPLAPGGIPVVLDGGIKQYEHSCHADCKDNKHLAFCKLCKSTDFTLNIEGTGGVVFEIKGLKEPLQPLLPAGKSLC